MILVDTSVWIDHFRNGNSALKNLLRENNVVIHPFIIGELACGTILNRTEILRLLKELPKAFWADHDEVLHIVEDKYLFNTGIGWIDAHLIASALLTRARIMTLDKRFSKVVATLHLNP